MRPLTDPMKLILTAVSEKNDPNSFYPNGQLRLILNALIRRELIRYQDTVGGEWHLTPSGRNYITQMKRETNDDS